MFLTLLKKELLELNKFYFFNSKTGKWRSSGGTIGMILLFALVFLSLGASVYALCVSILTATHAAHLDWVYFSMMGAIALLAGSFGGIFVAYPALYNAKDTELLLSLPLKPSAILGSRMVGIFISFLPYELIVWVPTLIAFCQTGTQTSISILFSVLLFFVMGAIILAITCFFGWIVALIANHLKNKSIITVIFSFAFICLYYVVYFKLNSYIQLLTLYIRNVAIYLENTLVPLAYLGKGCLGDTKGFLCILGIALVVFSITWILLAKSFIKTNTTSGNIKKGIFKQSSIKTSSVSTALLRKELKRFWSSPAYIMNGGLGLLVELGLVVFVLIKLNWYREYLGYFLNLYPEVAIYFTGALAIGISFISGINMITAPSVSLEGKYIWVLQSLPISPWKPLLAKQELHFILNIVPALLCVIVLGFATQLPIIDLILAAIYVTCFILFSGAVGLFFNLRHPNMHWTNETVPIKQGVSTLLNMIVNWALVFAFGIIYFLVAESMPATVLLGLYSVLLIGCTVLLNKWIKGKGAKIFSEL